MRARAKITRIRPSVATTSESQWGPVARCFVEMEMAASENITIGHDRPADAPDDLEG